MKPLIRILQVHVLHIQTIIYLNSQVLVHREQIPPVSDKVSTFSLRLFLVTDEIGINLLLVI